MTEFNDVELSVLDITHDAVSTAQTDESHPLVMIGAWPDGEKVYLSGIGSTGGLFGAALGAARLALVQNGNVIANKRQRRALFKDAETDRPAKDFEAAGLLLLSPVDGKTEAALGLVMITGEGQTVDDALASLREACADAGFYTPPVNPAA